MQKRLSMFVLRAKAKLVDASGEIGAVGFAGDVRGALSGIFDALPDGVHVKVEGPHGALIRVPDAAHRPRFLWVGPKADRSRRICRNSNEKLTRGSAAVWDWLDIHAGEPRITQPTVRAVRPADGQFRRARRREFQKGCYPGQEIVARSQYRGTIKRRTALAQWRRTRPCARQRSLPLATIRASRAAWSINAASAPGGGVDCWSRSSSRRSKTARCTRRGGRPGAHASSRCPTVCRPTSDRP